jgi:two-component system response regulator HydG
MKTRKKAKILVVDDDRNLLDLLVDTLDAIGYQPIPAPGGVEALEKLSDEKFDLIITDIKMPDIDGIQLLKKVRRYYPELPVLFITGVTAPEIIARALPDGVLAKPFRISHIEDLIESTLKQNPEEIGSPIRKVLVVEDDEKYRKKLMDTLNYCYYVPFSVHGGRAALKEIENGKFDALIADFRLEDMDSLDLMKQVKARVPDIPLILTGDHTALEQAVKEFGDFHIDGYLEKPFEAGDIIKILNRLTPVVSGHN